MTIEHFDVMVVGAGISGIGAGCHLQTRCPDRTYVILEGRTQIGGTWDLFRFPGVRSDSDMYTLGYPFRPWKDGKAIADGPSILNYIRDTANEFGIDRKILYQHRVVGASNGIPGTARPKWAAANIACRCSLSARARFAIRVQAGPSSDGKRAETEGPMIPANPANRTRSP